jgi:hypothetical protein
MDWQLMNALSSLPLPLQATVFACGHITAMPNYGWLL